MVVRTSGMMAAQAAATVPLRITLIQAEAAMAGAELVMVGEMEAEVVGIDHGRG
ncbi:MAG: hypothetical protein ACO1QS_06280 [Verrucomicrobiota bacterium]